MSTESYVSIEDKIQALILKWLKVEHGIDARCATIDESDWEIRIGYDSGCNTCGYGADPSEMYLTVWYACKGDSVFSFLDVQMNPLTFLAELFKIEETL